MGVELEPKGSGCEVGINPEGFEGCESVEEKGKVGEEGEIGSGKEELGSDGLGVVGKGDGGIGSRGFVPVKGRFPILGGRVDVSGDGVEFPTGGNFELLDELGLF